MKQFCKFYLKTFLHKTLKSSNKSNKLFFLMYQSMHMVKHIHTHTYIFFLASCNIVLVWLSESFNSFIHVLSLLYEYSQTGTYMSQSVFMENKIMEYFWQNILKLVIASLSDHTIYRMVITTRSDHTIYGEHGYCHFKWPYHLWWVWLYLVIEVCPLVLIPGHWIHHYRCLPGLEVILLK